MGRRYLKFFFSAIVALCLYSIMVFSDCRWSPITIKFIPDSLIGIVMVVYAFLMAGVIIWMIVSYFDAVRINSSDLAISRVMAMRFLIVFGLSIVTILLISKKYC